MQILQQRVNDCVGESHSLLVESTTAHALQLNSLSERLETSQTRIESHLQAILANQQRSKSPILSKSLDASSPEGRETWMELGRLLRDEGITPAMIQKNRGCLVNAMKSTLRNELLSAVSTPQSYATASEYAADDEPRSSVDRSRNASYPGLNPSVSSQMSVLGSAPPRSSSFPDAFLKRQDGAASSLDQKLNVDDGMESLLQGMGRDDFDGEHGPDDTDIFEMRES